MNTLRIRLLWVALLGMGSANLPANVAAAPMPETLVVKDAAGFQPGLATAWKAQGDTAVFTLAGGADGEAVANVLRQRLAGAEISSAANELRIRGIPIDTLLGQLAGINISGGGDPLADLGELGARTVAMQLPEGGGSIRASKPTALPAGVAAAMAPSTDERCEAEVLEVQKAAFPSVSLRLKVTRAPSADSLSRRLRRGTVVEAKVQFARSGDSIDFSDAQTQANLAAYYAVSADRVTVHMIYQDNAWVIDWLERSARR